MAERIMRRLTLDDIADARAYERERAELQDRIVALKKIRRVSVGPFVTLVFENRDTIRYQVQEMARVERLHTDEAILQELDTYNPLIPEPGTLSATLFIELTSKDELMEWLPKLVGIERSVELRIGPGADAETVTDEVDEAHAQQLTRDEITASVHYIRFRLTPEQVERFASSPVEVAVFHPSYHHTTPLSEETKAELLADLRED
jgi:hypothetical protein